MASPHNLSQLKAKLRGQDSSFPECLTVDAIGKIAADKDNGESADAMKELVRFLNHAKDEVRYAAYCWLLKILRERKLTDIATILSMFEARGARNARLVEIAKKSEQTQNCPPL